MKRLIPIIIMIVAIIYSSGCLNKEDDHEEEYQGIIDENASLSLFISNQAIDITYDPVDINVYIDHELMISDLFFADPHRVIRYDLNISYGNHTIIVSTKIGEYGIEDEFIIVMKFRAIIDFWGYGSNFDPLTFRILEGPPAIV